MTGFSGLCRAPAPKLQAGLGVALAVLLVTALCPVALAQRPPVLITPPQSQLVAAGTNVGFAVVVAASSTPLTYQWSYGSQAIPGATGPTLALTNVVPAQWGSYSVTVDNGVPPPIIANATLTVVTPVIQSPRSVSLGATLRLLVSIYPPTGAGLQWGFKGTNISGATNMVLIVTNAQFADAAAYSVVVTNASGSLTLPANLAIDPTFTKITTGDVVSAGPSSQAVWGDLDNDGYLDLVILMTNSTTIVCRNNRDGTFSKLAVTGLPPLGAPGQGPTAALGDFDNDGYLDLVIGRYVGSASANAAALLRNNGDGTFTNVTNVSSFIHGLASFPCGAGWVDYNNDGWLDLFVGDTLGNQGSVLFQNDGNGAFSQAPNAGLTSAGFGVNGAAWADYDNDGYPDLFFTADPGGNLLYHNNGHGTFTRVTGSPSSVPTADSWPCAWGDYDNDGFPDLFVANGAELTARKNFLYHNEGNGTFTQVTQGAPVMAAAVWSGCSWGDYDNDGFLDLFVSNYAGTNALYHNNGDGTFTAVSLGSLTSDLGTFCACGWADYDNDGFLDLFVANKSGQNLLYRNNGNSNGWVKVRCVGSASNRSGIGAKVRVRAFYRGASRWQLREIFGGDGVGSSQPLLAHFGLGDATNIDTVRIEWPSGIVQELHNVAVKQFLTVTEPARLSMSQPGQLHIQCWKGMAYRIEASPDLSAWTPLATVTNLNVTGGVRWTDPSVPGPSARFYRVVKP